MNHADTKRQNARVEAITGRWYCTDGGHLATGAPVMRRGRKVCQVCAARIAKLAKTRGVRK